MFTPLQTWVERSLGIGLKASQLEFSHMAWRTLLVFCFAVVLFRLADRRFLGRNAGYDVMLGIVLGSVLSRGINGEAAFFPTLGASALLVILHHVLSTAAYHSHLCSQLVKGGPRVLVSDGKINQAELRRCKITDEDLDENLRLRGQQVGTEDVQEARLERSGEVSIIKAKQADGGKKSTSW
jgi:uncharacterized membrane protein YcaP (DUF421 family)